MGSAAVRALIGAVALAAAVVGCGGRPEASEPVSDPRPSGVDAAPERLIAIAPSLVEVVYALGAGDKLVGVGSYVRWPPEAAELPRLGGLFDPQLETIVTLEPDLALLLPSEAAARAQLEELGIEVMTLPSETLGDVEAALAAVARRLGIGERGRRVVAEWRSSLAARPAAVALSVLLVIGRGERLGDLVVAGPNTFLGELLARLGVTNAARGLPVPYAQISAEEVIARSPGLIVELQPDELSAERRAEMVDDWSEFAEVAAVRSAGCVRVIDGDYTLLPGPRLSRLYAELASAVEECGESL